jgi:hypothetical protein
LAAAKLELLHENSVYWSDKARTKQTAARADSESRGIRLNSLSLAIPPSVQPYMMFMMEVLMSMTYSSSTVSSEAAAYGGFADALGGIATIVLAIVGLSGITPEVLVSISTVVFGAALLIQGGAMLSEFAQIESTPEADVAAGGGSMSALSLVGVSGIVLGVLALLGVYAPVLTAVAVIAFGTALLISSSAVWHLLTSRSVATRFQSRAPIVRIIASEVAAGSVGMQAAAGLAAIVLGILAVCGIYTASLTLIALLVAGTSILLTGSTLSGTMVGFMRSTTTTAAARAG